MAARRATYFDPIRSYFLVPTGMEPSNDFDATDNLFAAARFARSAVLERRRIPGLPEWPEMAFDRTGHLSAVRKSLAVNSAIAAK